MRAYLPLLLPLALSLGACASTPAAKSVRGGGDPTALLANADANRDGKVTRDEFAGARDRLFSRLDRNGDGLLSADDQGRRRRRGGQGGERMKQLAAGLDTDGDGRVSRAEFVDGPALTFDRADGNGDGVVDARELSAFKAAVAARRKD